MNRALLAFIVIGIVTIMSIAVSGQVQLAGDSLALVGGTIYSSPTDAPVRNGVVLIRNGKIAGIGIRGQVKIAQGTKILDCTAHTITAGFWNSHVHFMERKWSEAASIWYGPGRYGS